MEKTIRQKKYLSLLLTLCLSFVIILLILQPEKYTISVYNGMLLFAVNVLPALFPFFFITKILTSLSTVKSITNIMEKPVKRLFRLPGECAYIFFMSMLSGYPVGAKLISEIYGKGADKGSITRIAAVCSTSGPLFIIGTVGFTMLGDKTAGFIIYASHIISVLLYAVISGLFSNNEKIHGGICKINFGRDSDKILSESIYGSVISILIVGGYISVFYMLTDMLAAVTVAGGLNGVLYGVAEIFKLPHELVKGFLGGFIEITRGCLNICSSSAPLNLKLPFCSFIITFGGLCIIMQSFAFLSKCGINYAKYLFYKVIQSLSAAIICFLLCLAFNI